IYGGTANNYFWWIIGVNDSVAYPILDALTPQTLQPKTMRVVRWPNYHQNPIWNNGAPTGGVYTAANLSTMTVEGFCRGNGQSFFYTSQAAPTLFAHPMGHSCPLGHFGALNCGWKHHDLNSMDCMMSYNFPTGFITQGGIAAVGPVGGGAAVDTGWPHTVPNPLPNNSSIDTAAATGNPAIQ